MQKSDACKFPCVDWSRSWCRAPKAEASQRAPSGKRLEVTLESSSLGNALASISWCLHSADSTELQRERRLQIGLAGELAS